jgi:hypothetical protein
MFNSIGSGNWRIWLQKALSGLFQIEKEEKISSVGDGNEN